jgi:arsenite methyltransferase
MSVRPCGSYGIDAPWVPFLWAGSAVLSAVIAVFAGAWRVGWWTDALCCYFAVSTAIYLLGAGLYWHASLRGKFLAWERLLNSVPRDTVARTLDLGCGRGAVAIMTALRFRDATVTGIDLWRTVDQSGNSADAARTNADANRVTPRLRFVTGDMTSLPFEDASFDLVTAGLSIHNIPTKEGRAAAVREAVRVMAPGGQLTIMDIRRTREYTDELRRLGLTPAEPESLGWGNWWTGPWMASSVVRATK